MQHFTRVLVVGASGFLGRALMQEKWGTQVLGTFYRHPIPNAVYLDLRDQESIHHLLGQFYPDLILFAGGITDTDYCEQHPYQAFKVNSEAAGIIARFPVRTVYYSSDYVFEGTKGNYTEYDSTHPLNIYGQSKLTGEQLVLNANSTNIVIRVSGLYGKSGEQKRSSNRSEDYAQIFAEDDRFSSPVLLDDVVSATRILLNEGTAGIFHVAGPDAYSRYEFEQLLSYYAPVRTCVVPVVSSDIDYYAPRPKDSSLSTGKLTQLGWVAKRVPDILAHCHRDSNDKSKNSYPIYGDLNPLIDQTEARVVLVDCVGGILTPRCWLPQDPELDSFDLLCGSVQGYEDLINSSARLGWSQSDLLRLQKKVVFRYAPNPYIWMYLHEWQRKYKLALVNNGLSATFRNWVYKYRLDRFFHLIVNSEELGTRKPNKKFFEFVCENFNETPARCLLLDDDAKIIRGASKLGMKGIRLVPLNHYPLLGHFIPNEQRLHKE